MTHRLKVSLCGLVLVLFVGAAASAGPVTATAQASFNSTSTATSVAQTQPDTPREQTQRATVRRSAGILTLDNGDIDATPGAYRGNYLVLQPWEFARIPVIKRQNPHIKIIMYKDVSAVRKDSHHTGIYSTGVSYTEAEANGWLLTDRNGDVIEWSDWTSLYPTAIQNRAYQKRWGDNVLREMKKYKWDGVMMDDTLTYLSHPTVGNKQPTQIPTHQAMYNATESFLDNVAGRIQREGFLAVPNVTVEWNTWRPVMQDWTRYVSGWENEYFVKWGLDRNGDRFVGADWDWKADMATWLAARRVPFLAITYSNRSDVEAQIYHRATWLLTWNGRTGSSIFVPEESNVNHWLPKATVEIGQPTNTRRLVKNTGVWRRNYTRGAVLVNPTHTARTIRVGAGYRTLSGKTVQHVRVGALSGVILRHR